MQHSRKATCIGCGCDDWHACVDVHGPCSWIVVDYVQGVGVCSCCEAHVARWHAGDRTVCMRNAPQPFASAEAPSVYLAGPDVFRPDIERIRQERRRQCEAVGLIPLDPCDNDNLASSRTIYVGNIVMLDRADLVIANLTPFRGVEPDSGTVWESARASAHGKPVFGYMAGHPEVLFDRVAAAYGPLTSHGEGLRRCDRDRDGNLVENWGLPLNLMLAHGLTGLAASFEEALQLAVSWRSSRVE